MHSSSRNFFSYFRNLNRKKIAIFCPTRALVRYFTITLNAQPDHAGIRDSWSRPIVATTFEKGKYEVEKHPLYLEEYDFVFIEPLRESALKVMEYLEKLGKDYDVLTLEPEFVHPINLGSRPRSAYQQRVVLTTKILHLLSQTSEQVVIFVRSHWFARYLAKEIRRSILRRPYVYDSVNVTAVDRFLKGEIKTVITSKEFNVPVDYAIVADVDLTSSPH